MCNCKYPGCTDCPPAFDKEALQASVNLMANAISRVTTLERALKQAHDVIEAMKSAIGKDCYRYSSSMTWHTFALQEQSKIIKVMSNSK